MSPRNRVFLILGLLTLGSLIFYLATVPRANELQVIGTVDANEVMVSSKIPGRIQQLTVVEGQKVKAGELIAVIESRDLQAALAADQATVASDRWKLSEAEVTVHQNHGETSSAALAAAAQVRTAQAALAQAQAQYDRQEADTSRDVALAKMGIVSAQVRDEQVASLQQTKAAVDAARQSLDAAQGSLRQARAHELLTTVSARTVNQTRYELQNAIELAHEAQVEVSYASIVAPVSGIVNQWASRQGEVVSPGTPIVTIMDLKQTWVYAPVPETDADAVKLGDKLRVVMPSGATVYGKIIAKAPEADFATERDVSRSKRDIKTVQFKLLIPNPGEEYVPGMTAEIYIPKSWLVRK